METLQKPKVIGIDGFRSLSRGRSGSQARQLQPELDSELLRKDAAITELAMRLQQTLEITPLIQTFCEQTAEIVPCDSVCYSNETDHIVCQHGQRQRHHCRYQLDLDGQILGEIECSRATPFKVDELELLERLLAFLIYPLRNALLYQKAIAEARQDPLTGIANRAAFDEALERKISAHQRHLIDFSLLVIDVDFFKKINDTYGHAVGDMVLREVAQKLRHTVRRSDEVFRYGGEEFAVLLGNTDARGARFIAERIRNSIANTLFEHQPDLKVTVSIGYTSSSELTRVEEAFKKADEALYLAKERGRNQVIGCDELLTE